MSPAPLQRPDHTVTYGLGLAPRAARLLWDQPPLLRASLLPALAAAIFLLGSLVLWWFAVMSPVLATPWPALQADGFVPVIRSAGAWLLHLLLVIGSLLLSGVSMVVGWGVATIAASPLHDNLSSLVEGRYDGLPDLPNGPADIAKDVLLGVQHTLMGLLVYGMVMIALWLLALIPAVGTAVSTVLSPLVTSFFLAREAADYSLSRRRWSFAEKVRLLRRRPREALGLGLASFLLSAVPVLNVLGLPVLVTAGTLWILDLQAQGELPDGAHA